MQSHRRWNIKARVLAKTFVTRLSNICHFLEGTHESQRQAKATVTRILQNVDNLETTARKAGLVLFSYSILRSNDPRFLDPQQAALQDQDET